MNSTYNLFDINIAVGSRAELLFRAAALVGRGGAIATVNPEILNSSLKDPELKSALLNSLCIPDGIGVELALRSAGCRTERFPGVELGEALLNCGRCIHLGIIGGKEGIAESAMEMLVMRHGNVIPEFSVCGYNMDYEYIGRLLDEKRPDIVFVCLGSPLQELFISKMRNISPRTLFIGLGGSADIYSEKKRRAPSVFRALGLEWVWRIMREPKRLKRVPSLLAFYVNAAKFNRKSGKIGKNAPKTSE